MTYIISVQLNSAILKIYRKRKQTEIDKITDKGYPRVDSLMTWNLNDQETMSFNCIIIAYAFFLFNK